MMAFELQSCRKMDTLILIIIVLAIPFNIALLVWNFRRANNLLEDWAARNDYRIIHKEYRWFRRGPFFWFTGRGQIVFRIEVADREGLQQNAFVRVGGFFLGMLSNNVEVSWDRHRR